VNVGKRVGKHKKTGNLGGKEMKAAYYREVCDEHSSRNVCREEGEKERESERERERE